VERAVRVRKVQPIVHRFAAAAACIALRSPLTSLLSRTLLTRSAGSPRPRCISYRGSVPSDSDRRFFPSRAMMADLALMET
jgi:hypothetical protein